MSKLIPLRHGQSIWNLKNRFTGWTDVDLSDDEITDVNIPTGVPLVYELDDDLNAIKHYCLGDEEKIRKATEAVAGQVTVKDKKA